MKTIITIQHTQSVHHTNGMVSSWTDWDLSELGVQQAKRIGEKLKTELAGRAFVMYSSDLKRAKQTADNVGEYLGVVPILRTELRERNLGRCCGKSVHWLRENLEQQERTIDDRLFSDAESRRDEWNRLKPLGFINVFVKMKPEKQLKNTKVAIISLYCLSVALFLMMFSPGDTSINSM